MVSRFVLMVEAIDGDDRWLSSFVAPGQKEWDSLGLLHWAIACENNGVGQAVPDTGDEGGD